MTSTIESDWTNGYGRTPRSLLRDPAISIQAKAMYGYLEDYATPGSPQPFPGIEAMCEHLSAARSTVRKWITELVDYGWITKRARFREDGGQTSNAYTLHRTPVSPTRPPQPIDEPPPADRSAGGEPIDGLAPSPSMTPEAEPPEAEPPEAEQTLSSEPDGSDPSAGWPKSSTVDEATVRALCEQLADAIAGYRNDGSRPKINAGWMTDMRRLCDRGPADDEPLVIPSHRVEAAIRVVFTELAEPGANGFCWAKNVQSPFTLRKGWNKILADAKARRNAAAGRHTSERIVQSAEQVRRMMDARGHTDPTTYDPKWDAALAAIDADKHAPMIGTGEHA